MANEVRCSGIMKLEKGIAPCIKVIDKEAAIELRWKRSKQLHDCFFCNFKCLQGFIQHSFWEKWEKNDGE